MLMNVVIFWPLLLARVLGQAVRKGASWFMIEREELIQGHNCKNLGDSRDKILELGCATLDWFEWVSSNFGIHTGIVLSWGWLIESINNLIIGPIGSENNLVSRATKKQTFIGRNSGCKMICLMSTTKIRNKKTGSDNDQQEHPVQTPAPDSDFWWSRRGFYHPRWQRCYSWWRHCGGLENMRF